MTPYLDTVQRGLFATRAPSRPCPIGLTCVQLLSIAERRVTVRDVDVLDGSLLLDIKPYVPRFDAFPESKAGWLEQLNREEAKADSRFSK